MKRIPCAVPLLALLASSLLFAATPAGSAAGSIEGIVPLPPAPPAAVMAKRYELVSRGGALAALPPLAVVWLEGDFPESAEAPRPAQILQRDYAFEPAILPIRVGATVAFPNEDEEYHNVFSYSPAKRFDLGRYMPDERPVPTQVFEKAGQIVLRCDIHEHMRAVILVIDSPYFVTTDPSGSFRIDGAPAGDYTLKAWVDTKTTLEKPVRIRDGETVQVAF